LAFVLTAVEKRMREYRRDLLTNSTEAFISSRRCGGWCTSVVEIEGREFGGILVGMFVRNPATRPAEPTETKAHAVNGGTFQR